MDQIFQTLLFDEVKAFIRSRGSLDEAKILAAIATLRNRDSRSVHIKVLRGPIRELIVKQYRLVFFSVHHTLYFVGAFIKKSRKTPKHEIDKAENIYKKIR